MKKLLLAAMLAVTACAPPSFEHQYLAPYRYSPKPAERVQVVTDLLVTPVRRSWLKIATLRGSAYTGTLGYSKTSYEQLVAGMQEKAGLLGAELLFITSSGIDGMYKVVNGFAAVYESEPPVVRPVRP